MRNHNNLLRTIGITSALTIAVISGVFGVAVKSGWGIFSAIAIFAVIGLLNWQWLLAATDRLSTGLDQLSVWLYRNDIPCLLFGMSSMIVGVILFLNMLSNLKAFGLTMFLGTMALLCMFGSCLIVPFFEKRFGQM